MAVDDEPDLQQLILLKFCIQIREGIFPFKFAGNGVHALERLAEDNTIDLLLIDKSHVGAIIGNVSSKGIPTAMFTAVSKTLLKVTSLKGIHPDSCLESVNKVPVRENRGGIFLSALKNL